LGNAPITGKDPMQTPTIVTKQRKYQAGTATVTTTTLADIVVDGIGTIAGAAVFRQDTGVLITSTFATNIITVTQATLTAVPCYWFAVGDTV